MQPLLIVLAAALRAPAEDLARRRLPTLSYRRGEEQARSKYGRPLWVPARRKISASIIGGIAAVAKYAARLISMNATTG